MDINKMYSISCVFLVIVQLWHCSAASWLHLRKLFQDDRLTLWRAQSHFCKVAPTRAVHSAALSCRVSMPEGSGIAKALHSSLAAPPTIAQLPCARRSRAPVQSKHCWPGKRLALRLKPLRASQAEAATGLSNGSSSAAPSASVSSYTQDEGLISEAEKARRQKISKANKGKVPWNKGVARSAGQQPIESALHLHDFPMCPEKQLCLGLCTCISLCPWLAPSPFPAMLFHASPSFPMTPFPEKLVALHDGLQYFIESHHMGRMQLPPRVWRERFARKRKGEGDPMEKHSHVGKVQSGPLHTLSS